ncbi:MAG: amidohydrolase family protein [Planctomycetota bacterium]|nr:amidohydrolase family protein [Planctomycetota bacterium]
MSQIIDRRVFLKSTFAAGAVVLTGSLAHSADKSAAGQSDVDQSMINVCDTHLHLWDLEKFKLPWLSNDGVQSINRSFVMKDYLQATAGSHVTKAVYMEVNVAPSLQTKEAEYVLELCRRDDNPMLGAVIGGSPQSADFRAYITPLAGDPHLKGVRTVLHDADRPKGMCLEPQFVQNIKLLGEHGLRYDLCMRPDELTDGARLAEKCPKTQFVVDHCGNLSVQNKDAKLRASWEKGIRELAALPNVICKISGIIVTADRKNWTAADLAPNMNFCMNTFGEDRVMFAGDWPVCTLTAPFGGWLNALKEVVRSRPKSFQQKLFHDNAVRFYELG